MNRTKLFMVKSSKSLDISLIHYQHKIGDQDENEKTKKQLSVPT